jgi:hypothetical protein
MRIGIVLSVALTCACATTTSAIAPDDKLDPRSAYLYGRFHIRADEQPGSFGINQSIGFHVRCGDDRTYTIWFGTKRDVQVLKVHPARCALVSAVFTDGGIPRHTVSVEKGDMLIHEFVAGRAYYLGDYFARGIFSLTLHSTYSELFRSWAMDPADDRYEGTTADMKQAFHNLAGLPTADARFIAPGHVPKPGAVVIKDPNEPPMSPERVARVAPFVRRTFATPASCEAACSTGQCLPFRGEAGPAMTCIVRCNTDKDCPDGLACNCPGGGDSDRQDCHSIATTPADQMARICLSVESATQAGR